MSWPTPIGYEQILRIQDGAYRHPRDLDLQLARWRPEMCGISFAGCWRAREEIVPALLRGGWLRRVRLLNLNGAALSERDLLVLLEHPDAAHLETLYLGGIDFPADAPSPLRRRPMEGVLSPEITSRVVAAVAKLRLRELCVHLPGVAWDPLAEGAVAASLIALQIVWGSPSALQALFMNAVELRRLELTSVSWDAADAAHLIASPMMLHLEHLAVGYLSMAGLELVVEAAWPNLACFKLDQYPLGEAGLRTIANRRGMRALRELVLHQRTAIETGETEEFFDWAGPPVSAGPVTRWLRDVIPEIFPKETARIIEAVE